MGSEKPAPTRFVGLDVHKFYLIAVFLDAELNELCPPQRVQLDHLQAWITGTLQPTDAVALEMTTNTWEIHDALLPQVHSVTVVHPPHVALITRAQVITDKIAARCLARLLAKGLLVGIWVPPQAERDRRALVAQRAKMVRLSTQAKNRLHSLLHRHAIPLPEKGNAFAPELRQWWMGLPLTALEKGRVACDLDTLTFARAQIGALEKLMVNVAAADDRVPLLIQLPGIALVNALAILAAIGDISRFKEERHLVGYAGLGARIHDSGLTTRTGRITKSGRRDLRAAMVEAAQTAANTHPRWKAELARLEPRLGRNKAIVAIARKLLVGVWHVLTKQVADRHAEPARVARKLTQYAYRLGQANRPLGQTAGAWVRTHLDRLGIGRELDAVPWGPGRKVPLPPSTLPAPAQEGCAVA